MLASNSEKDGRKWWLTTAPSQNSHYNTGKDLITVGLPSATADCGDDKSVKLQPAT